MRWTQSSAFTDTWYLHDSEDSLLGATLRLTTPSGWEFRFTHNGLVTNLKLYHAKTLEEAQAAALAAYLTR